MQVNCLTRVVSYKYNLTVNSTCINLLTKNEIAAKIRKIHS